MTIFLLRHGATDVVRTHLCGRTPGISLNQTGWAQAEALAARLPGVDEVIASPIERALQTAEAVARKQGLAVRVIDAFAEFDFGTWTGRGFDELAGDAEWQRFNAERESVAAPGGESMTDVQNRALAGLMTLEREGEERRVAIVSHGDVIRSLLLGAAGSRIREYWRLAVDLASLSECAFESARGLRLIRMNDTCHLDKLRE